MRRNTDNKINIYIGIEVQQNELGSRKNEIRDQYTQE
jgi:hypothetical protein